MVTSWCVLSRAREFISECRTQTRTCFFFSRRKRVWGELAEEHLWSRLQLQPWGERSGWAARYQHGPGQEIVPRAAGCRERPDPSGRRHPTRQSNVTQRAHATRALRRQFLPSVSAGFKWRHHHKTHWTYQDHRLTQHFQRSLCNTRVRVRFRRWSRL